MTVEARDEAKAWTCATHVLLELSPDHYFEGILHDKSHAAFNQRLVESYAAEHSDFE